MIAILWKGGQQSAVSGQRSAVSSQQVALALFSSLSAIVLILGLIADLLLLIIPRELEKMAVESSFTSDDITFVDAIALTQALLNDFEQSNAVESTVCALVRSENGARGFFVTYLSDDRPFADHPTPAIIAALRTSPTIVAPLLVKNVAMSTAMAITHRRHQNAAMVQGSERVRSRTARLIQSLQLPQVQTEAQRLLAAIETGQGDYQTFLERWGYDLEQRQAIQRTLAAVSLTPEP